MMLTGLMVGLLGTAGLPANTPEKTNVPVVSKSDMGHSEKWKLVWSDEFDYEGMPDGKKWDYEEGFIRNSEMQYYTRARLENARVENGFLVIEGRKEQFRNPGYKSDSPKWKDQREFASYTAASLVTLNKAGWKYGRIEVRAKLPQGKGVWPAIWTMGVSRTEIGWPRCGEIDIMEFVGKDPNGMHANAHFAVDGKHTSKAGKLRTDKPYADFHVYAIEWYEDRIDFFFDDIKYHTFPIDEAGKGEDNPFRKPHYLLINLALGGSWGGPIDDSMLPQKYLIDYVRVYELKKKPI
jgi:beta-glucanase (GH16 family)